MEGTGSSLSDSQAALRWCADVCTARGWRLAYSMLRNEADAQEAVQQAFLVALRKRERIPLDNPWPWFATVIAHEARNVRRKFQRPQTSLSEGDDAMPLPDPRSAQPDSTLVDRELAQQVSRALGELPETEREALVLTQISGMTYAESARALGVPLGTFNHRVSRGLSKLRDKLGVGEHAILGAIPVLPVTKPPVELEAFLEAKLTGAASGSALPATITITGITMKKSAFVIGAFSLMLVLALGVGAVVVTTSPAETNNPIQMSAIDDTSSESGADRDASNVSETSIADPDAKDGPRHSGDTQPASGVQLEKLLEDETNTDSEPDDTLEEAKNSEDEQNEPDGPPNLVLDEKTEKDPRIIRSIGEAGAWMSRAAFHTIRVAPDDDFVVVAGDSHIQRFAATGEPEWSISSPDDRIYDIVITPDGERVVVASSSDSLAILDASTGRTSGSLHLGYSASRLAISPDGQSIAVGSSLVVARYQIDTGQELAEYSIPVRNATPHRNLEGLSFSSDGALLNVASVGGAPAKNCLCVFDVEKCELVTVLREADLGVHIVSGVAFSPDGTSAIVEAVREEDFVMTFDEYFGYEGYSVPLDASPEERRKEFDRVYKLRLEEYQDYLESKGLTSEPPRWRKQKCVAAVVDLAACTIEQFLDVPNTGGGDVEVAYSADGLTVAAWGMNRLHLFDAGVWKLRAKVQIDTVTSCMAFNANCDVVYCDDDSRLRRFDVTSGSQDESTKVGALKPREGALSMSPTGDLVVFEDEGGLVAFDVDAGKTRWRLEGYRAAYSENTFGPDGLTAYAIHGTTGLIHVVDAWSGKSKRTLALPQGIERIADFAVSGDGRTLSGIGNEDGSSKMLTPDDPPRDFVVWKLDNDFQPDLLATPEGLPYNYMGALMLSHDGSRAAASYMGGFVIVDMETGTSVLAPIAEGMMNNIRKAFTQDAAELVIISLSTNRGFWRLDCESLAITKVDLSSEFDNEDTDFSACLLSPDGHSLILAPYSWDNTPTLIRVDRKTGEVLNRYPGHVDSVSCMAQSADGSRVASLSETGVLHIWSME